MMSWMCDDKRPERRGRLAAVLPKPRAAVCRLVVMGLVLLAVGCANGAAPVGPPPRTPLTDFIEKGLMDQIPPPDEDVEFLVDMKLERRAYGRAVVEEGKEAVKLAQVEFTGVPQLVPAYIG